MLNNEDHLQQAPYLQQFTRVSIWPMVHDTISISCGNIIYGTVINRVYKRTVLDNQHIT